MPLGPALATHWRHLLPFRVQISGGGYFFCKRPPFSEVGPPISFERVCRLDHRATIGHVQAPDFLRHVTDKN